MINNINSVTPTTIINTDFKRTEKEVVSNNPAPKKLKNNYDNVEIKRLMDENDERVSRFRETIQKMLAKQCETFNLVLFDKKLNVSVEDSQKAAEAIADGGEYSVDAVATRIMGMAVALSNGDKTKIGLLKDAVIKGFKEAGLEFNDGKGLPEICNKTYDEIMKRFDAWENDN